MANNIKVKLNTSGVREMLKSEEMKSICEDHASQILQRCGSGYDMDTYTGTNRVNAMVFAETFLARADNQKNNTLLKAVKG
jgi:hypothetical protein